MKKCPTCGKEFPDSMRFCQTDGTLLVEKVEDVDPYKTVVANSDEIAAAIPPADPFKTMVASPPPKKVEDDILQLPDEPDSLKTMVVSRDELKAGKNDDASPLDLPPMPASYAPSAPLIEPKAPGGSVPPSPPKTDNPFSTPPKFDDISAPKDDATAAVDKSDAPPMPPPPFESKPFGNDFSSQSPYGNQENKPIPSPFDLSMPPGYMPPSVNPFEDAKPSPPVKETIEPPKQPSPFDAPTPFGNNDPFNQNQPLQQSEWTPPPAPDANWQNQEMSANAPSSAAPTTASGKSQTLALVSLILGIVGVLSLIPTLLIIFCGIVPFLLGIGAAITGFLARGRAKKDPEKYGGAGLALGGIIGGVVSILATIGLAIITVIWYATLGGFR